MKPLDVLTDLKTEAITKSELAQDVDTFRACVESIRANAEYQFQKLGELAAKHGLKVLLAEMPQEESTALMQVIGAYAESWSALTDKEPPELPEDAVVVEPVVTEPEVLP